MPLLSGNFIKFVSDANHSHAKIVGHLFNFHHIADQIHIHAAGIRGFRFRWYFMSCISLSLTMRLLVRSQDASNNTLDAGMTIMFMSMIVTATERYRCRSEFPEHYVDLWNALLQFETKYCKGKFESFKVIDKALYMNTQRFL